MHQYFLVKLPVSLSVSPTIVAVLPEVSGLMTTVVGATAILVVAVFGLRQLNYK